MTSTPILCTDSIAQWQSVHILTGGARVRFRDDAVQYLAFGEKYWDVMYDQHTHILYRLYSSMVEHTHSIRGARVRFPDDSVQYLAFVEKYWDVMYDQHTHICADSIAQWQSVHILSGGARVRYPADAVKYLAFGEKYWDEMYDQHTHIIYRFHSSMVECPHSIRGGPGSIPGRCS